MKPKIAFYMASFEAGGAERNAIILANYLAQQGYRMQFWVRKAEGALKQEVDPRIPVHVIPTCGRIRSVSDFVRLLCQERPDALLVIAALLDGFVPILARQFARTPTRVAVHNNTYWSQALKEERRFSRNRLLAVWGSRLLYPRADTILAVSQGVAHDAARVLKLPLERIHVVYNPTITPDLQEKACAPLEHPWFTEGYPPIVLAAGRLETPKGFDVLLRSFASVRQQMDARLVILGKGSQRESLLELAAQLGVADSVDLPGFEPNPFRYMSRASVFVLSSRYEGLPNVLIQAMACGCPVVSTNCPSGPEEILDGGKYGELTPVDNPSALAEAIIRVLRGERKHVPAAWLDQFRLETVAARYLEGLLGKNPQESAPPCRK